MNWEQIKKRGSDPRSGGWFPLITFCFLLSAMQTSHSLTLACIRFPFFHLLFFSGFSGQLAVVPCCLCLPQNQHQLKVIPGGALQDKCLHSDLESQRSNYMENLRFAKPTMRLNFYMSYGSLIWMDREIVCCLFKRRFGTMSWKIAINIHHRTSDTEWQMHYNNKRARDSILWAKLVTLLRGT